MENKIDSILGYAVESCRRVGGTEDKPIFSVIFKTPGATVKDMPQASAEGFLSKAKELMAQRGKQYDAPSGERSMDKTVTAFNTVTGYSLKSYDGWLFLQILKDVRQWQKPTYHEDSAEDCVAYAALKAESLQDKGRVNVNDKCDAVRPVSGEDYDNWRGAGAGGDSKEHAVCGCGGVRAGQDASGGGAIPKPVLHDESCQGTPAQERRKFFHCSEEEGDNPESCGCP